MKIICENCGAKYSIADEKVKGKVFKIRCKKCQESIVIRGDAQPEVLPPVQEQFMIFPFMAETTALPDEDDDGDAEIRVFDYSGYQNGSATDKAI